MCVRWPAGDSRPPGVRATPRYSHFPGSDPKHRGAERSHDHHVLFEILTYRTFEYNNMVFYVIQFGMGYQRVSHGRRSVVCYSPWGRKESDTTERLHFTSSGSNR